MDIKEFKEKFKKESGKLDHTYIDTTLEMSLCEPTSFKGLMNTIIVMEELGELQQEISKFIRAKDGDDWNYDKTKLLEELADVYLGIRYMQVIAGITQNDLNKAINVKIKRQRKRTEKKLKKEKDK